MSEEQKDTKIIGKTDKSAILITDTSIKILKAAGGNILNPLGVVTLIPGVQLELGRQMDEFAKCLKMVRKPLALQKIAENNGQCTWHVIRLGTGKVPEAKVCTINTIHGIIAAVSFNQSLVYNATYRKYQPLSVVHQLKVGKAGSAGQLSRAVSVVAVITGQSASDFKITESNKSIIVYTAIKELSSQYRFTFLKDEKDYFNLLSIGFLARKA